MTLHAHFARTLDPWLQELDETWSLVETRARIVEIRPEAEDLSTFVLAPNRHWPGHRAGQFVPVSVAIEGVRHERCYSLSSAPGAPLAITVRRVPGGKVSSWFHERAAVGDVVRLGQPTGDFVLGAPQATGREKLLLVSGGSGITPVLAIIRTLPASTLHNVVFVHAARSDAATPHQIREELESLPSGGVHFTLGELTPAWLETRVPDWAARTTMLCGPSAMMDRFSAHWTAAGAGDRLKTEQFLPTHQVRRRTDVGEEPTAVKVTLAGKRKLTLAPAPTLLEALEAAGERPAYGCRQGICNTCRCRKTSGLVEDLATGIRSGAPGEEIRLCTSRAWSDLELEIGE